MFMMHRNLTDTLNKVIRIQLQHSSDERHNSDPWVGCALPNSKNLIRYMLPGDLVLEPMNCTNVGLDGSIKFKMCVHKKEEDIFVSGSLLKHHIWEPHIVRRFLRVLKRFPRAVVIDIGAQLGMYGLQAAAMGRKVVFVEASGHNVNHILASLGENGMLGRVCRDLAVVRNAVAEVSGGRLAAIYTEKENNGGTAWGDDGPPRDFA
eukprot:CAMPEP_0113699910 /NCGR_PEP_ID=MMETSP0038_2-20120614/23624_1 /TAXON_ID=2898 /ORGANISM="Cryptomonas paramecium" /LENGTH=205 /DNA_ID=CAMNT_0000623429 /DNA_START=166 /DNA_END=780 /DNA_ORIENTATION=- /assembly_acc=CAM_ASM_000170